MGLQNLTKKGKTKQILVIAALKWHIVKTAHSSYDNRFGVGGWGMEGRPELPFPAPLILVLAPTIVRARSIFSHFRSSAAFYSLFLPGVIPPFLPVLPLSPFSHSRLTNYYCCIGYKETCHSHLISNISSCIMWECSNLSASEWNS